MVANLASLPAVGAPASEQTERAVLGATLLDNGLVPQAVESLTVEHFSSARHRAIWRALLAAWQAYQRVDLLVLRDELERAGDFGAVGGVAYLASLDLDIPDLAGWDTYVDVLEEHRVRRAMWEAGHRLIRQAQDGREDARVLLAAEQQALSLVEIDRGRAGLVGLDALMEPAMARLDLPPGEAVGIPTGFSRLDNVLLGLQPGQLIYLAGRPGMGKSQLAGQMATAAAKDGYRVAFFSLEMTSDELTVRMLAAETGILHQRIRARWLHTEERGLLKLAASTLSSLPLAIDDGAAVTPQLLAARAMRRQREHGVDLVVVDHVQLMASGERSTNENEALTIISRNLKILAKRLSVPVLALSQLSRRVDERSDKRPVLSDLRASGSLEQDADVVLFVYRENYYKRDLDQNEGEAEVIVAKQRGGGTGIISLYWQGDRMRFMEPAEGRS